MSYRHNKFSVTSRLLYIVLAATVFGSVLAFPAFIYAAPLTYSSNTTISLSSPTTAFTIVAGSMADTLQVNATSVLVTLSSSTGGSFTLTAASPYDLSIASSSSGGTVSQSCVVGTASTTISQNTGSTVYTIAPTTPQCLYISTVAASTTYTTAAVTWTTDDAANSEVDYGPTTAYGSVAPSSVLTTSHSISLPSLPPDTLYHFEVKSTDAQGETAVSADQTFMTVVDTVPPTVALTSPANGSSLSGTVTVSANATDNVAVASVQFLLDGANLGPAVTIPPYQVSWNTASAANGSHTLTAIALDTSGNTATSTITMTVANVLSPSPVVNVGGSYGLPYIPGVGIITSSTVAVSSSTTVPAITSSTASLSAEIAALQAQLAVLLKQASQSSVAPTSTNFTFTRNLQLGITGSDVKQLQLFLIFQNTGLASRALAKHGVTKNFGALTRAALIEFQKKAGIKPTSGYFGPKTRAYVNNLVGQGVAP
jgi:hypothetical protein